MIRVLNRLVKIAGAIILNDYFFVAVLIIVSFSCSLLNFNGKTMHGLVPAYIRFGQLLEQFVGQSTPVPKTGTFPMWGYGLLFVITKSKTLIILFQQLLSVGVIFFIDKCLKILGWKNFSRIVFRIATIGSVSWFFYNTIIWPYSISSNLLLLSLFLLLLSVKTQKLKYVILSGVTFGLMLNFRSDYYYFGIGIILIMLILGTTTQLKISLFNTGAWLSVILLMLIPWGIYSYQKTGKYLQKSTNGGHVLFISLGQLPDNKWGITPSDNDPYMREIVDRKVGLYEKTLEYQADKVLTKKWIELISNDKQEFAKKSIYNYNAILENPFYHGELLKLSEGYMDYLIVSKTDQIIQTLADSLPESDTLMKKIIDLNVFLYFSGRNLIRIFFWGFLIFLLFNYQHLLKNEFFIIFSSLIFYQLLLMILAYFMRIYNTNIILVYEIMIIYFWVEANPLLIHINQFKKNFLESYYNK